MRVVFLSPFAARPLYGGAVVRIHHLVHGLARRYDLVWACRAPAAADTPCPTVLNSAGRWRQLFNPAYVWRLLPWTRGARLLIVSSIISGVHALALQALSGLPLIYDAHNVEHLLLRRLHSPGWRLMASFEKFLCQRASAVWVVSKADADSLQQTLRISPDKVRIVPNGVDMSAVQVPAIDRGVLGVAADERLILFFGVLTYLPNVQAVRIIEAEIVPRLERRGISYRILIAGAGSPVRDEGRIRWTGFIDNLYGVVKAADVVIVPLVTGSGTRMKILEAIACGTRVVSTVPGAEGLEVDGVQVSDDWDEFVDLILSARRLGPRSAAFVARYSWDRIVEAIEL